MKERTDSMKEQKNGQKDAAGNADQNHEMENTEQNHETGSARLKEKSGLQNGMSKEEYKEYVKQVTPVNNTAVDVLRAFITGGIICLIGQCINGWLTGNMHLGKEEAAAWTSIILVAASVLLTGFHLYSKIVKWGGAGALVPITGFANSVASPAIEAQTEGQVFGIGCSIFKIAGPVILYGVFSSWVLGVIYWIWKMWMPV